MHAAGHPVAMLGSAVPILDRQGRVRGFRSTRRLAPPDATARRRLTAISHRLDELLATGTLNVAAQPIVDLTSGRLAGVEALARFPDQRPPDVWFAEAAEAGRGDLGVRQARRDEGEHFGFAGRETVGEPGSR